MLTRHSYCWWIFLQADGGIIKTLFGTGDSGTAVWVPVFQWLSFWGMYSPRAPSISDYKYQLGETTGLCFALWTALILRDWGYWVHITRFRNPLWRGLFASRTMDPIPRQKVPFFASQSVFSCPLQLCSHQRHPALIILLCNWLLLSFCLFFPI